MGLLSIWRHHLQNEANRRIIAAHPTVREQERVAARERLHRLGPPTGRRCTAEEWAVFAERWMAEYRDHRRLQIAQYRGVQATWRRQGNEEKIAEIDTLIAELMEKPITWMTLNNFAQSRGQRGARPPRELERSLRQTTTV